MKKTIFYWMGGGVLLVTGAFFIPGQSGSLWPSLIWAGVAALLYLLTFYFVWIRRFGSATKRKAIGGVLAVIIAGSLVSAGISFENSRRQSSVMKEIRKTIDSGVFEVQIKQAMLKTLRQYHVENTGNGVGIGELFLQNNDSLITDDSLFYPKGLEQRMPDLIAIRLAVAKPDCVVLLAESGYVEGRDANFKNESGSRGKFQTRAILTKEGVQYERIN